jgi:hypothetical protein
MKYENLQTLAALFKPRLEESGAGKSNVERSLGSVNDALAMLHRLLKPGGQLQDDLKRGQFMHLDKAEDEHGENVTQRLASITSTYIKEVERLTTELELMVHSKPDT